MLIAISGVQSSGKTSVLTDLKEQGYNVIEQKTARSILHDWDTSLETVYENLKRTKDFQGEILKRKQAQERRFVESTDIWFVERCYSDLATYTMIALGRLNEYNKWVNTYYERCQQLNNNYQKIIYLKSGYFGCENDGVRSHNVHYQKMVDSALLSTVKSMTQYNEGSFELHKNQLNIVDTPDHEVRLRIVHDVYVETLNQRNTNEIQ